MLLPHGRIAIKSGMYFSFFFFSFFFFLFFFFLLPITDLVFKDNEIFDEKAYAELLAYMQAMHGNMSEIQEAHRVTQKGQQTSFEEHREMLARQHQTTPASFCRKDYLEGESEEKKLKLEYIKHLNGKVDQFRHLQERGKTNVVPVVQGRTEVAAWKIATTGFNYAPTLDPGWYGSGIYFSTSVENALSYDPVLIIALANVGNPFPAIEHPFAGKGTLV